MTDTLERTVVWQPHPGFQTRFLRNPAFEVLGGGAAGPGKTDALMMGALRYIGEPWCKVLFLRRSFPELREVMDRAHKLFPGLGGSWKEQEKRWTFPSGATYEFGYADRYADLMQYDGREFTEVAWDELGHVPEERWWLYIMTRIRSAHPAARLRARASAMPGGVGNAWIRKRFVDPCGPEGGSYIVTRMVEGTEEVRTIAYVPGRLDENPTIDSPGNREYRISLMAQPEAIRRALLDGDWEAAEGLAFPELGWDTHGIPARPPEPWWHQWGGFDWGFAHWAVFWWFARDDRGRTIVVDTIWMRRLHPDQLAEAIWERVPVDRLSIVYAGRDCWDVVQARGNQGPTIAETFTNAGMPLAEADIRRKPGFSLMRDLISYRKRGANGEDIEPRLVWMDTIDNRRTVAQLETLVLNPSDPEDVLKVNADPTTGEGGDDAYDAGRYGLLSYEPAGKAPEEPKSAWDPEIIAAEFERTHKAKGVGLPPKLSGEEGQWW